MLACDHHHASCTIILARLRQLPLGLPVLPDNHRTISTSNSCILCSLLRVNHVCIWPLSLSPSPIARPGQSLEPIYQESFFFVITRKRGLFFFFFAFFVVLGEGVPRVLHPYFSVNYSRILECRSSVKAHLVMKLYSTSTCYGHFHAINPQDAYRLVSAKGLFSRNPS
jgi:hypothetical protein